MPRRSVAKPVSISGRGLHTGAAGTVTFRPAPAATGLVFRRVDLAAQPAVPAEAAHVFQTERRTSLRQGRASVESVEHLLAAVSAAGIDDLLIDIDGPEVPGLDGSASGFWEALERAGFADRLGRTEEWTLQDPMSLQAGDSSYTIVPGPGLSLHVSIHWDHPAIGTQAGQYAISPEAFRVDLAPARTFGFADEIAELQERGLIRGADDRSGILVGRTVTGLRWPDEFVRHKALDLVGDLALLGRRLNAHITAARPSHATNIMLVNMLRSTISTGTSGEWSSKTS